jgi:hypothetical protein
MCVTVGVGPFSVVLGVGKGLLLGSFSHLPHVPV